MNSFDVNIWSDPSKNIWSGEDFGYTHRNVGLKNGSNPIAKKHRNVGFT